MQAASFSLKSCGLYAALWALAWRVFSLPTLSSICLGSPRPKGQTALAAGHFAPGVASFQIYRNGVPLEFDRTEANI